MGPQDVGVDRQGRPQLWQDRGSRENVPLIGWMPASTEPGEPWRALRDMPLHVRDYMQFFAGCLKSIRPVIDLGRIPLWIAGQLQVEFLHQAALANAAFGDDERHPRAAILPIGTTRCACVELAAKPLHFILPTNEFRAHDHEPPLFSFGRM